MAGIGSKTKDVNAVRKDLETLGLFLWDQARQSVLSTDRRRLQWATSCISDFLQGRSSSLDHAFGLVQKQGNPGRLKVWAERAALADAEGLTVAQVAAEYGLADEKSVREGLKRGREINRKKRIKETADKIAADLKRERVEELAQRESAAKQYIKSNKIRVAPRRRG